MTQVQFINNTGRDGIDDPAQSLWKGITVPFSRQPRGFFEPRGVRSVIWSAIVNIIMTPLGTRPMLLSFGSRLPEMLFEPNDDLLMSMARTYIIDAVTKWEPRVRVLSADAFRDQFADHRLHVSLKYEILRDGLFEDRSFIVSRSTTLAVETPT